MPIKKVNKNNQTPEKNVLPENTDKPLNPRKKLDRNQEQQVIKLYSDGLSTVKIAKQFNVSNNTISRVFLNNNIEKRPKGSFCKKLSEEQEQEIIDLYLNKDLTVVKIAAKFNVHSITISTLLKTKNVKVINSTDKKLLTDAQEKEMVDLHWQGYSNLEIAQKFNTNISNVRHIFRKSDAKNKDGQKIIKSGQKKSNTDQDLEIISLYKQGVNQAQLVDAYGLSRQIVRRILVNNNIKLRRNPNRKLNKIQEKKAVILYEQNVPPAKIASDLNVNYQVIKRVLEKYQVEIKPPRFFTKSISPVQEIEILRLYEQGLSIRKISEQLNVGRSPVKRILTENNITIKYPLNKLK